MAVIMIDIDALMLWLVMLSLLAQTRATRGSHDVTSDKIRTGFRPSRLNNIISDIPCKDNNVVAGFESPTDLLPEEAADPRHRAAIIAEQIDCVPPAHIVQPG
ncbi:hypothetical protein TEQG_07801 [Trichophyton equinum CBS 127.97]|uniref:Secreted protein n=1 Tax=Trichophyton equinum (strain ATCC MYA-4606 / CBS 127.97) TaxID=559882 RepID=F2Q427_TRIEC|nr:hypothetical protein TEQG_07801 [Trichophyton equinum CBS 127.97]